MRMPWWKPVKQIADDPRIQAEYERSIHSINVEAERQVWLCLTGLTAVGTLLMCGSGVPWGWSLLCGAFVSLFGGAFWILLHVMDRRS